LAFEAVAPTYLLDANTFIQPKQEGYYAPDICPGYWKALRAIHAHGVHSLDRVLAELTGKGDEVEKWAKAAPGSFFAASGDANVVNNFAKLMQWVAANPLYMDAAKQDFAGEADGWLVAFAMSQHGCRLVTFEKPNPARKTKVPIPSLCDAFGVKYCTPFDMLRDFKIKLDWNP
jgi:uncharacterized protein DUF4411